MVCRPFTVWLHLEPPDWLVVYPSYLQAPNIPPAKRRQQPAADPLPLARHRWYNRRPAHRVETPPLAGVPTPQQHMVVFLVQTQFLGKSPKPETREAMTLSEIEMGFNLALKKEKL